ncbi:MAG TPA: DUF1731 domain-containing protein [Euzebyales bacterium]|nr:DUF1731 domain-containing protein [Euzebyales bacterium]
MHLNGKRVDCRPTRRNVDLLIRSRVESVRVVGQAVRAATHPPGVWVQASTLAVYGDTGDTVISEDTVPNGVGPRQMVTVAQAWEHAYHAATTGIERTVLLRAGITIGGDDDPASAQLARLARLRLGGRAGSGRQWLSWIALDDVIRVWLRAIDDAGMSGLYLATAPHPIRNRDMMAAVRAAAGVRIGLAAPAPIVTAGALALGTDPALVLLGRRAVPARLLDEGFMFTTPGFDAAIRAAIAGPDRRQDPGDSSGAVPV